VVVGFFQTKRNLWRIILVFAQKLATKTGNN